MRISNWKSAKKQAITKLPAFTVPAAIILFIASFIAFWNGSLNYQEQRNQLDWAVTNATVSYVYKYYDAFHSHNGGGQTLYDVHFEYYADNQIYTGILKEQHSPMNEGNSFRIKYNPQNPKENTLILEPLKSYLVSGSVFAGFGLMMVILTVFFINKKQSLG